MNSTGLWLQRTSAGRINICIRLPPVARNCKRLSHRKANEKLQLRNRSAGGEKKIMLRVEISKLSSISRKLEWEEHSSYSWRHLQCGDIGKLLQYKHDFGKLKFVRISANFPLIWVHLCFCYSSGLLSDVSLWTRTLKLFHELEMLDCPHSLKSKQDISFYGRLLPPPPASFSTQHLAKMDKLWDVKIPLTVSKPSLLCLS